MSDARNAVSVLRRPQRLFAGLAPQELLHLSSLLDVHHYRRGEFIYHTGDKADRLYFLDKGAIKVNAIAPDGEERILDIVKPGEIFGALFVGPDGCRPSRR